MHRAHPFLRLILRRKVRPQMTKRILALTLFALALPGIAALSQETPTPTQALISLDSKTPVTASAKDITLKIDNRATSLVNLTPIPPNGAQVALLIDDGLRTGDIFSNAPGTRKVNTKEIGEAVIAAL